MFFIFRGIVLKLFIKFFVAMIATTNFLNAHASPMRGYEIQNYFHPNTEPKGLLIVNFNYYSGEYMNDFSYDLTYRVYCPTKTVRDITEGKIGKSRTAIQEDKQVFGGDNVMRGIVRQICL
jgi:hypothetical protein